MLDAWSGLRTENEILGRTLGGARRGLGLALAEVAYQLDPDYSLKLDAPTLSRIERGQVVPTYEQGKKLTEWALQSLPGIETPVARHSDPDTSHEAAESVSEWTIKGVRLWWLNYLASFRGMNLLDRSMYDMHERGYEVTDEGAWRTYSSTDNRRGSSQSGFRTRRSELVKMGLVEDSGLRFENEHGRDCIAWQITDLGIERLKEIK